MIGRALYWATDRAWRVVLLVALVLAVVLGAFVPLYGLPHRHRLDRDLSRCHAVGGQYWEDRSECVVVVHP